MSTNAVEIDQSLDVLNKCYTYSGSPDGIDNDNYPDKNLDWKLLRFGELARSKIFSENIFSEISQLDGKEAAKKLYCNSSIVEYIWFLFGQRNWGNLYEFFKAISHDRLNKLPVEVSDIYILACLRSLGNDITTQSGKQKLLQRLQDAQNEILAAWPEATVRHKYFGAISAHVGGDVDGARAVFAKIPHNIKFAGALRAVFSILSADEYAVSDEFQAEVISTSSERNVVLVSLDRNYYRKYFENFQNSVKTIGSSTNDKWGLHLHCVGFDPRNEDLQPDPDVGVTVDKNFLTSGCSRWRAAYSASARYIFCERYLREYQQIIISDIDGIIVESLDGIGAKDRAVDVLLYSPVFLDFPEAANHFPWNSIIASNFAIQRTEGGVLFAKTVGAYLRKFFSREAESGWPWFADQNALFYSYIDTKDHISVGTLDRLPFTQGTDWRQFSGQKAKRDFIAGRTRHTRTKAQPPLVEPQSGLMANFSRIWGAFQRYFTRLG